MPGPARPAALWQTCGSYLNRDARKTHKGRALEMDEVCMPEKRDRVVAEMHSERKLLAGLPEPQTTF